MSLLNRIEQFNVLGAMKILRVARDASLRTAEIASEAGEWFDFLADEVYYSALRRHGLRGKP